MPKVEHYAWPGAYPLIYIIESDDGCFESCPSCVNQNRVGTNAKWTHLIHYEGDPIQCEVCGKEIESAYGNPN